MPVIVDVRPPGSKGGFAEGVKTQVGKVPIWVAAN